MVEDGVFGTSDTLDEINRLSRPSKLVDWKPNKMSFFELIVPPTVYPPREDTDLLANRISALGPGKGKRFLEVGSGSGAISCLASSLGWKVHACDVNPYAVATTIGNLESNSLTGDVREGGIGPEPFPFEGQFDLIVWNLPYIPHEEVDQVLGPMEEAALIDTDTEGLAARMLRSISSKNMLAKGGKILILGRRCSHLGAYGFAYRTWDTLQFDDGEELVLTCLWKPYEDCQNTYVESTGSTNEDLLNSSGVGNHLRAGWQSEGRGRRGRHWSSIENCYAGSWIISEGEKVDPGYIQLSGGLAVINSINSKSLRLKWPNDLLIDSRKVCGILVEGRNFGSNMRVVMGIGINLKFGEHTADVEVASLDEIFETDAETIDKRLHCEVASLLEIREDLPPVNSADVREQILKQMKLMGRPKYRGIIYDEFSLNQKGELVLGENTVDDGEDIVWI